MCRCMSSKVLLCHGAEQPRFARHVPERRWLRCEFLKLEGSYPKRFLFWLPGWWRYDGFQFCG